MKPETYNTWAIFFTAAQTILGGLTLYVLYKTLVWIRAYTKVAASTLDDAMGSRQRESKPFFLFPSNKRGPLVHSSGGYEVEWPLVVVNKGADVYETRIESLHQHVRIEWNLVDGYFEQDAEVRVRATTFQPWPEKWMYQVRFVTLLHEREIATYEVIGTKIRHMPESEWQHL